ncbi:MAG: DUF4920 domain-containing protein [Crocinitomicaceae bacterium]
MKKLFVFAALPITMFMVSCGGDAEEATENDETTDSTAVVEDESTLAFDGVDKGAYTLYGHTDIDEAGAVSTVEMFTHYESTGEFTDKVTVSIANVCQKAGCWITFAGQNEGDEIRVVFRDHFTIPIETPAGTEAILLGSLISDTISVDMQKHYLDDAKEAGQEVAQEEYDAITEDKIELSFDCESILVKK